MCLQTVTQFGDSSHAVRLRELENIVEGTRAGLAAHFTEALALLIQPELCIVSEQFE